MPADFTEGFFVRVPAWHRMGIVLENYPGRDEAYRLAGHDYTVIERPNGNLGREITREERDVLITQGKNVAFVGGKWTTFDLREEKKGLYCHQLRDGQPGPVHGNFLEVTNDSFEVFQNTVAWDLAEELFDQGFSLETGITLAGGAVAALTLKLNEPVVLPGDDSIVVPFGCLSWAHDGSGALKGRTGTIRQVCANTVAASEAEGKRLGTDFTIRHTKNGMERVKEAKKMLAGARESINVFQAVMQELAEVQVTPQMRRDFADTIIGDRVTSRSGDVSYISMQQNVTTRVVNNIERERAKILGLFNGPTIPEAHKLTGYGLHLAGVEYFDHLRNYRSDESYVQRTLLTDSKEKASLVTTIAEITTLATAA